MFHGDALNITDLHIESAGLRGILDLELGLPVSSGMDLDFDIDLTGEDIRHLVPVNRWFEPEHSEYRIKATGHKADDLVNFQHFDMSVGGFGMSMQGEIANTNDETNSHIIFSARTGDLSSLGSVNGRQLPALPMELTGKIDGHARHFSLRDFNVSVGQSDIAGTLHIDLQGEKPEIDLQAQSNLVDLGPFLAGDRADMEVETGTQGDRLIPATPLPLAVLDMADTSLGLRIAEVRLPPNKVYELVLEGGTSAGALNLSRLSWTGVRGGNALGSMKLVPLNNGNADISLDFGVENGVLRYTGLTKGQSWLTPGIDVLFQARGRGANLQQLAGSLNGRLFIGTEGGTLKDVNLSLLDTFILEEVFKLIFAKTDDDEGDLILTCAAAIWDITDGLVETDPAFAFTTDKIRLIAKGTLDLKTEKLHFNFSATPRNILHVSFSELLNPYILVSGTLKHPEVGIDPARALLHGGAAIGTSGISILAKAALDRVGVTAPVCKKMLDQAKSD